MAIGAGLVGPARKAEANTPTTIEALHYVKTPPLTRRPQLEEARFVRDEPDPGPDPETRTEAATVSLHLTAGEAAMLRGMLHEAVTNDLDLLEDTLYQAALVDTAAVERVALAIRLDVALE